MVHASPFDARMVLRRLRTRLKMRHLSLLLHIEREQSLTRVAEAMGISQPAVTSNLSELESMFGAPLFDRSVRGMRPTPMGEIALSHARAMVNDMSHMVRDMEAAASGQLARLHLGVVPFLPGRMVSETVQLAFPQDQTRLPLTLYEESSPALLDALKSHRIDMAIARPTSRAQQPGLEFEMLYSQPPRMVANRRLAAHLSRQPIEWAKLVELDWVLGTPQTTIREHVVALFIDAGLPPPLPLVETLSFKLIGEIIAANENAISIVPADVANELTRVAGVSVVPFSFRWNLPPLALFSRPGGLRRPVELRFAQALREYCAARRNDT